MSCPDCGKRVPILFNALEDRRCIDCLRKARIRIIKEQKRARAMLEAQEPKTHEEIHKLNQAAKDTCAWETTCQTEEEE